MNLMLMYSIEVVTSGSRNDENETKTKQKRQKQKPLARKGSLNPRPTADSRPHPTVGGSYGISSIGQDLPSWIQELKTLIKDFVLQLGDSRDDLRRHYSPGCLELKNEEQSKATNWGLIGTID
ncbi:hypothetical protein M9H77_26891 [Catharanthus roseus]|uniref:Uncharacterized protein n=1 Tax=Catharanthus roseus TaxID=4058 RepID=A0ACC0ADN9_CATRO|nr:hypothetical protein M9H77_26891 [Catharanthus roseus]